MKRKIEIMVLAFVLALLAGCVPPGSRQHPLYGHAVGRCDGPECQKKKQIEVQTIPKEPKFY